MSSSRSKRHHWHSETEGHSHHTNECLGSHARIFLHCTVQNIPLTNSKVQRHSLEGNSLQLDETRPPFQETQRFIVVFRRDCEFSIILSQINSARKLSSCFFKIYFLAYSQNYEKLQVALSRLYVLLSFRMGLLGSHWTDFHENWYLKVFNLSRKFKFH